MQQGILIVGHRDGRSGDRGQLHRHRRDRDDRAWATRTDGVDVSGWSDVTIGGTVAGSGNVISANAGAGIGLLSDDQDDLVEGNLIGTDITGANPLGNATGVLISGGSLDNTIGGTATGAGNTIAYNAGNGVDVTATAGAGNTIRYNSMFGDAGPGIVLGSGAVNAPTISNLSNAGGDDDHRRLVRRLADQHVHGSTSTR